MTKSGTKPGEPQRPTAGQRRILQLCCRVAYTLYGAQSTVTGERTYQISERGTSRLIQNVTPQMVDSLEAARWLVRQPHQWHSDSGVTWRYEVTEAGMLAANGPVK